MTEPTTEAWLSAGIHLMPTLVWAVLAERTFLLRRPGQPRTRLYLLLPIFSGALALHYLDSALAALLPMGADGLPSPALYRISALRDITLLVAVTTGRHMLRYFPSRDDPPQRLWLGLTSGSAVALGVGAFLTPVNHWFTYQVTYDAYLVTSLILMLLYAARAARFGGWGLAGFSTIRTVDVVLFSAGLLAALLFLHHQILAGRVLWHLPPGFAAANALLGILIAVPLALRLLGEFRRGLVVIGLTTVGALVVFLGGNALVDRMPADVHAAGRLAIVLLVLPIVGPGRLWLAATIGRLGLWRSRGLESRLHDLLPTLSPELGTEECSRRALTAFTDAIQLSGAAVLLDDGPTVAHGAVEVDQIRSAWPCPATAARLFGNGVASLEMRELPEQMREPLLAARVIGVFPVVSPRRRLGWLFLTTGPLGAVVTDEDTRAITSFADQLALVLDGADLLGRVVRAERSLAQAEKMSAIGELAARMAHEIRNPITGARSLVQLVARDPASPENVEHIGIVLDELGRVERQISALVRFARREDLCVTEIDLGAVVRQAADAFAPACRGRGIELEIDAPDGIQAQADPEKIRQIVRDLLENAADAVCGCSVDRRHVHLRVRHHDGCACLDVKDSGPGLPEGCTTRVFDPFFSGKTRGAGLGLAIVKRVVEAHGGRIHACNHSTGGAEFRVELPVPTAGASAA